MPTSARCRENHARSVSVDALIDENLHRTLSPQILRLREASHEPITVYVDSVGGNPAVADSILNLISTPDADGSTRNTVTVVTRLAASAAANLLAAGDYVIAYPNTTIYFHGLRYIDLPETTFERATSAAKSLRDSNESRALSLANKVIERLLLIYLINQQRISELRQQEGNAGKAQIELFVEIISHHLSSHASHLCERALDRYFDLEGLSDYVFGQVAWPDGTSYGMMRSLILRAIIQYKMEGNADNGAWKFEDEEIEAMLDDFQVFTDYSGGYGYTHRIAVETVARSMGKFLLTPSEVNEMDQLPDQSDPARDAWLVEKVKPVLQPIWFFTISVCRLLQLNENPLTAVDAYWLGIVNEVLGQSWPTFRTIVESAPSEAEQVSQ